MYAHCSPEQLRRLHCTILTIISFIFKLCCTFQCPSVSKLSLSLWPITVFYLQPPQSKHVLYHDIVSTSLCFTLCNSCFCTAPSYFFCRTYTLQRTCSSWTTSHVLACQKTVSRDARFLVLLYQTAIISKAHPVYGYLTDSYQGPCFSVCGKAYLPTASWRSPLSKLFQATLSKRLDADV